MAWRNTLIVVEHDEDTMAADYLIDVGPGAGGTEKSPAGTCRSQSTPILGSTYPGKVILVPSKGGTVKNQSTKVLETT